MSNNSMEDGGGDGRQSQRLESETGDRDRRGAGDERVNGRRGGLVPGGTADGSGLLESNGASPQQTWRWERIND